MDDKNITYYIGQIAKELGLSQRTIRYYEEFGFLKPSRTEGGFRTYSERDVELLRMVLRFKDLGMRLDEIRTLLLPSENTMTSDSMLQLCEALKGRRDEFQFKIKEYEDSISQIENILNVLSKCNTCGLPSEKGVCERCLKTREENGEFLNPLLSSLVPDEHRS